MHSLDIDQLRTFIAVVETESFTAASDQVHKTQSAVSMQIKRLEEQLDKKLFLRQGRGITLSPDGHRLLPYARDLVERSDETMAAFNDDALQGNVYLGTADDYAERYLPAILAGFSNANPLVEVSVVCENSYQLDQRIAAGELDMAVVTHNEVSRRSELIRTEKLLWVTSSRHIVHTSKVIPLALGSPHCLWRAAALAALTEAGVEHRLLYSSYSATVLGAAVLAGLAVAVLPESALRPGMRVLESSARLPTLPGCETETSSRFPPLPPCEIGLLQGRRTQTQATKALADHIRKSLQTMPNGDGSYIEFTMDPFANSPIVSARDIGLKGFNESTIGGP